MLKTNKALKKRLKITKKGIILHRTPGQNHFNAKERKHRHIQKKRLENFKIGKKELYRFLPYN